MNGDVILTAAQVWELLRVVALPAVLGLATWLYRLNLTVRDQARDLAQYRTDCERRHTEATREIERLEADVHRQAAELTTIGQGQAQILITLARLETHLQALLDRGKA